MVNNLLEQKTSILESGGIHFTLPDIRTQTADSGENSTQAQISIRFRNGWMLTGQYTDGILREISIYPSKQVYNHG